MLTEASRFLDVAAVTHRGSVRRINEDAVAVDASLITGDAREFLSSALDRRQIHTFLLADGMGGHGHGEIASREALKHLIRNRTQLASAETCAKTIEKANNYLFDLMLENPKYSGFGTTLAGIALLGRTLTYFGVGDSRVYLMQGHTLQQLTNDDSLYLDRLNRNQRSNPITKSLGGHHRRIQIIPEVGEIVLSGPAKILICSDGLTNMVEDDRIRSTIENAISAKDSASQLREHALAAGGHDNVSVLVLFAKD